MSAEKEYQKEIIQKYFNYLLMLFGATFTFMIIKK